VLPIPPRYGAVAVGFKINAPSFARSLGLLLTQVNSALDIKAQLVNTATVSSGGDTYPLYNFLDKGTSPHWIGEGDELLGSRDKSFGPVWGPVWHPGTKPYDITSRVQHYMEVIFAQRLAMSTLRFAGISSRSAPLASLRAVFTGILNSAKTFAESITPDSWASVKASYVVLINGRRSGL